MKSGEVKINDEKVGDAKILDGEEESKYWADFIEFKNKQVAHHKPRHHHKFKKFRRH